VYGLELGCSVRHTGAGAYCAASHTACYWQRLATLVLLFINYSNFCSAIQSFRVGEGHLNRKPRRAGSRLRADVDCTLQTASCLPCVCTASYQENFQLRGPGLCRYAILSCMPETTMDDDDTVVTSEELAECERLAQGRYSAMRRPGVEPATCCCCCCQ